MRSKPRLCLAASGGGHIRQLLDLEPMWSKYDCFFITEDTALGRSIAKDHECYFVPHMALGQARLGSPLKMMGAALQSLPRSAQIIAKKRPDFFITTGAGSMVFAMAWAKLFGAQTALVDSFARFEKPSAFAKLASPLANVKIAQSVKSAKNWQGSKVFEPFKVLDQPRPDKESLLFATVGATLPFERLTKLVADAHAEGLLPDRVVIQVGEGGTLYEGLNCVESLDYDELKELVRRADYVVCHGGTGSLITALRQGCRVIAVPRRFELGEHYDNHQAEITQAFADRGLIEIADDNDGFAAALNALGKKEPVCGTTDPSELIEFLNHWLSENC